MSTRGIIGPRQARSYALDQAKRLRPTWGPTRFSADCIPWLEAEIRRMIRQRLREHPTMGKTITPPYTPESP